MARILTDLPESVRKTRESKYPWAEWFDGQVRELEQGVDFKSDLDNFRSSIGNAAKHRGVKVTTRKTGKKTLAFQATKDNGSKPKPKK